MEKNNQFNINIFDNEQTALIKYGINNNIPPRLLIMKYKRGDIVNSPIITLESFIKELIERNKSLENIYKEVDLINTKDDILITDVAYIYYSILGKNAIENIREYYLQKNILFNESEFLLDYENWKQSFDTINECFSVSIEKFVDLQNILLEESPIVSSDIDITEKSVIIIPKVKYSYLSFFDNVIIDEHLVYCHFNYNKVDYYKVHYPVNFAIEKVKIKVNTMEFYIHVEGNIYRIKYNIEKNNIKFNLPLSAEKSDKIINIIKHNLPLEILSVDENLFRGGFNIYNIHLTQAIFYDFLLNNVVKDFMYINESSDIAEEKHHTTINFSPLEIAKPTIKFVLYQKITANEIKISNNLIPANTPYVTVLASKSKTQSSMYQLLNILTRVFTIYLADKASIEEFYTSTLPESLKELKPIREKIISSKRKKYTVKTELLRAYPELFLPNYSKKCKTQEYLDIVPEDEVEELKNETFIFKGKEYNKQVLEYPPEYFPGDYKRIYLTCNSENYPFIGVVLNKLDNKDKFPYIPCCFDTNQLAKKGSLAKFYKGPREQKTTTTAIIKTKKLLPEAGIGELPTELEEFIKLVSDNKFLRLGTIRDNNSLIHAVLSAIDPKYDKYQKDKKIKEALKVRKSLIKYAPVVKQELYDKTLDEIIKMILDENVYFDPLLFYRLLEEHFNISIYVFYRNKDTDKVELLLPRHKIFYAKYLRELETVLVYESWGPNTFNLTHPHCEIIAEFKNEIYIKKFPTSINNFLYNTFIQMYKTRTLSISDNEGEFVENAYNLDMTKTIFNYLKLITSGIKILGQYIDVFGKQRALICSYVNVKFTIIFPPSQPTALQIINKIEIADYKTIKRLFGHPYAYSMSNDVLDGMWYSGDKIKYYLYIPIIPIKYSKHKLGPKNPLKIEKPIFNFELIPYINKLYKDRIIFLQLLSWMFYLTEENNTVESFISNYLVFGNSKYNYNFSKIQEKLPNISNIDEAFKYLKDTNLIIDDKIYIYTEKLLEPIKYYLEKFVNANIEPTDIESFYTIVDDFKINKSTAMFIGKNKFETWLEFNRETLMKLNIIRNDLKDFDTSIVMPYFYEQNGKIYILQNVIDSDLARALSISYAWINELQFLGYNAPELDVEIEYDTLEINKKYEIYEKSNSSEYKVLLKNDNYIGVIIL